MSMLESEKVREDLNRLVLDKSTKGVQALREYVDSLQGFIPEISDKGSGPPGDWDPVRFACLIENHKALEIFIDHKFPISVRDDQGWSSILWCLSNDLLVSQLYDNGVDLDVISNDSRTAKTTIKAILSKEDIQYHPIIQIPHLNGSYSISIY